MRVAYSFQNHHLESKQLAICYAYVILRYVSLRSGILWIFSIASGESVSSLHPGRSASFELVRP